MKTTKQSIGAQGESLAIAYLLENDYRIITTNWRCQWGEIDIIAQKDDMVVFVEVKTCRGTSVERAFENISPQKMIKFIRSAYTYADMHTLSQWRIDAIGVALLKGAPPQIAHEQDAFHE